MKKVLLLVVLLASLAIAATATAAPGNSRNFVAHLSGGSENPPIDTQAQGQAIFHVSKDGTSIDYKLIASNIVDIRQAHIHMAPVGSNGSVVVWLYPSAPPAILIPGRHDGILAKGTITAANLTGPLAAQPLSALLDAMTAGNTYVNVHTAGHGAGEIRGQIK